MTVNFREGMRRLGLLLGVLGACGGAVSAWDGARTAWAVYSENRRFEVLAASPTMKRVSSDMNSRGAYRLSDTQRNQLHRAVQNMIRNHESEADITFLVKYFKEKHGQPSTVDDDALAKQRGGIVDHDAFDLVENERGNGSGGLSLLGAHPLLKGNKEGISRVNVDASGTVTSIQLSTGESVEKTEATGLWPFLALLVYPTLGFLIPWGSVRLLTWVGSGFFTPRP